MPNTSLSLKSGLRPSLGSTPLGMPSPSESPAGSRLNVAVTERAAVIDTLQAPVPAQAPAQPAKTEPGEAVGVSATDVPSL